MVKESPAQPPPPPVKPYPADKARGAQIELRRPWQRYVFIGGLAGLVVLVLLFQMLALRG